TIAQISARSSAWPPEVQQELSGVQTAAAGPDPRAVATRIAFLHNVLVRVPEFRQSLVAIKPPPGDEAAPFTHFLILQSPAHAPAAPDMALTFTTQPLTSFSNGHWDWIGAVSLGSQGAPAVAVANG